MNLNQSHPQMSQIRRGGTQTSQIEINAAQRNFICGICDIYGSHAIRALAVNLDGLRAYLIAQTNTSLRALVDQIGTLLNGASQSAAQSTAVHDHLTSCIPPMPSAALHDFIATDMHPRR